MGSTRQSCVLLLAVFLAPTLARAQMEELPPGAVESTTHRHLGFFLRLEAGGDYFRTSAPTSGETLSASGPGASIGFLLGGVNRDQGGGPSWTTWSGGLAFTATYN